MKIVSEKNQWIKLDQHYNKDCMNTHSKTCKEIIDEFPDVTDVVCSTGTGGTAAGLIKFLPNHVNLELPEELSEVEVEVEDTDMDIDARMNPVLSLTQQYIPEEDPKRSYRKKIACDAVNSNYIITPKHFKNLFKNL